MKIEKSNSSKSIKAVRREPVKNKQNNEEQTTRARDEVLKQKLNRKIEEQREYQKKLKQKQIEDKKNRKIFIISLLVSFGVLFLFMPIYPVKDIKINNTNYLRLSDIKINDPLGNYFSLFEYIRYGQEVAIGSEFIKQSNVKYSLKEMSISVNVKEYIPLAKDNENNVYFYEDKQVIKKENIDLYAPIVTGFDQSTIEILLSNLKKLTYDELMLIDTIEYAGDEDNPDLVKMGMVGAQTIYINMEQIGYKIPYYNQMRQIIDEKADGNPGIIHLEMGDYYEPK